ncbi:MAG: hypothetical protein OEZ24_04585 [Candidatus Bathyarchaeota archaeon]|nr:hypothetical protein [Candidatus Bathyarchaeota archaeon]
MQILCMINHGGLMALGSVDEITARAEAETLEQAFVAITGSVEEKELLAWRNQKGAGA